MEGIVFLIAGILVMSILGLLTYALIGKLFGTAGTDSDRSSVAEKLAGERPSVVVDDLNLHVVLIAVLALLMFIPLGFVSDIVSERGERYQSVLSDIAGSWGQEQVLAGPVLVVPYVELQVVEEDIVDKNGSVSTVRKNVRQTQAARFLPEQLDIEVELSDQVRERGIFRALVYDADVQLTASFKRPDVNALSDNIDKIFWNQAWVSIGLSDTRAINQVSRFELNAAEQSLSPGSQMNELSAGFHASVPGLINSQTLKLDMVLSSKGSGSFQFAPFGESTRVAIRSSWPHPSFQGKALPNEHEISADGFSATWEVPHLARNYPQSWTDNNPQNLLEFTAGVSMFETVSLYSQITRSVKYGLLFIGLTYLTLLIFELMQRRQLHAIQYALVGIALCIFFLVLLALSEHIKFLQAYLASSALTILIISVYAAAVLESLIRGVAVFGLLAALYAILYSLLQLEDYALLMGTSLLVVIIVVMMFITRNLRGKNITKAESF